MAEQEEFSLKNINGSITQHINQSIALFVEHFHQHAVKKKQGA